MVSAPATPSEPFGPARVPCSGFRPAWLVAKLASSCSLLVLSLQLKQDLLPAIALRGLFSFAQMCACTALSKTSASRPSNQDLS
jgi:hypothetical protein